jgi:flavin-dependent dehydrogenase
VAAPAEVDVLIVGARVAGSILAALLGATGRRVLVVDRATFPSATLSTHFFRGSGCAGVLRTLGVLEEVLATGAPPLIRDYNADALTGDARADPAEDAGELGFNLSVRRETLDGMLVDRARREPTVEVRERTSLGDLVWRGERVVGATIAAGGSQEEVRARVVVGADGHASRVARAVGAPTQEHVEAFRVLYYRYARGFGGPGGEPDGPEFSLGDDELVYVFPSDDRVACVALSLNLHDYARLRTDAEARFHERLSSHAFVSERAERAVWDGRLWACGPRPVEARIPAGPGWALVGDASMHVDPWTGEGMDNAAVHATFLATAIDDVLSGRADEGDAWAAYHAKRDDHALAGMRENVRLGRDLNQMREGP